MANKQSESVKRNHGPDFYARIGAMGGRTITEKTKLRGTASTPHEKVVEMARKGGLKSRKTK